MAERRAGPARLTAVLACLALAAPSAGGATAPTVRDADVARGIQLVEDGDYDGAIFLLDAAARRLAGNPERVEDQSQAYLHLGIAYLAKGHESAARAQFRQALARNRSLALSADRFSPKVIDAFEAARAEAATDSAPPTAAPAAKPAAAGGEGGSKGGSKTWLLLGGGALVAGGVAVAASGGGGSSGSGAPTTTGGSGTSAPAVPQTENFSGHVAAHENLSFPITVAANGTLEARLTWTNAETLLAVDLHLPGSVVATSTRTSRTTATLTTSVIPHQYTLQVLHRGGCAEGSANPNCTTAFTLQVMHP
jgi:hypothetical protein